MKSYCKFLPAATCALILFFGAALPSARAAATIADFDGDGRTDASVWNTSTGQWFVLQSSDGELRHPFQWGIYCQGDVLVPGDYDGDGATDMAFYRPSGSNWFIVKSRSRTIGIQTFEGGGEPVQADYDGDGKTDFAFFNAANGVWRIRYSSDSSLHELQWGARDDVAVPGDYDGDGRCDIAVFRQSESNWYVLRSSGGATVQQWGGDDDSLVPADYDGDGKTDYAVFRNQEGNWYIRLSGGGTTVRNWGGWIQQGNEFTRDVLAPGDYDGDGKCDIAVYRQSEGNWYILKSSDGGVQLLSLYGDIAVPSTYLPDYVITDPICDL